MSRKKCLYDYRGYHGIDVSLDISLFEYGLICKKYTVDYPDEYRIVCGVECDEQGNYNLFDYFYIQESYLDNLVKGEEWISIKDIDQFFETVDSNLKDWLGLPFIIKLHNLVGYFGWMDILGSVYYGFEINKP